MRSWPLVAASSFAACNRADSPKPKPEQESFDRAAKDLPRLKS